LPRQPKSTSTALLPKVGPCRRSEVVPEVIVYLVEGRAKEKKKALMKDITDAVVKNFGVDPEAVVVQIVESSRDDKSKGGIPFSER
jgi:4-oxalocrotonate tautomerase